MPRPSARRMTGAFYTPPPWAAEAHTMLDTALTGWREWLIWDPACGRKNLTAALDVPHLMLSTLDPADLAATEHINPSALTFPYDFLSGAPLPAEAHATLTATTRPVLFLMNPPYASAANQDSTHKAGVALNPTGAAMPAGYKAAAQQLYTQFLFRVMQLTRKYRLPRVAIALFSSDRFLTWPRFMEDFTALFGYRGGMFFNAAAFEDVAPTWGIAFTMWDSAAAAVTEYPLELRDLDTRPIGTRTVRPVGTPLSAWLKAVTPRRPRKPEPYVRLSNALKVNPSPRPRGFLTVDAFGYLHNNGDSVEHSSKYVGLYSTAFGSANGVSVTPENFERACVVFAVRKATIPPPHLLWVTGHDLYQAPGPLPPEFIADCVVYSLASRSGSNQSSLRGVPYAGHRLDVPNEFSWRGNTFVARWLRSHPLSPEARALLRALDLLFAAAPASPDLHLPAPDAAFWQLYLATSRAATSHAVTSHALSAYRNAFTALHTKVSAQARTLGFLPSSAEFTSVRPAN